MDLRLSKTVDPILLLTPWIYKLSLHPIIVLHVFDWQCFGWNYIFISLFSCDCMYILQTTL